MGDLAHTARPVWTADYHIHTEYSNDCRMPMEQLVQEAIRLGLDEICFTDHVDYGVKWDRDDPAAAPYFHTEPFSRLNVDYPRYVQQVLALREKYAGRITLRLGMEFGMQVHTIPRYEALFARWPFDFVLLSVHQVEDREFWNQDFQRGRTQEEYQQRYYQELLALVQRYHHYSVLAHMDLVARYDPAGPYPFEALRPVLTEILRTVIADGKGLEVNTSCHRYGLQDLTPSRDILRLYRDLGGRILTLGSDSHKPGHLGAYLSETRQQLRELGFAQWCTFERMEPVFHPL